MKKLFVFVPAILLILFLINSFVPKEKEAGEKTIVVFKSTDGGQTWQDISKGLPENLRKDSIRGNRFFANDKGLFLRVGNGLYHSTANATAPFWTKEAFPNEHSSITPGKSGISANNYWGINLKTTNGTSVWSPIFDNSHEPRIRSVFETARGAISSAPTKACLKLITVEKPGNMCMPEPM